MYQILVIANTIVIAGLVGGYGAYLADTLSSDESASASAKRHMFKRYCLLGIIAAAAVPLFLSVLQSALVKNIFEPKVVNNTEAIPFSEFLIFCGFCLIAAFYARPFLDTVSRQVIQDASQAKADSKIAISTAKKAEEQAVVTSELVQEALESDRTAISDTERVAATLPLDVPLPELTPDELKALRAMMKTSFRTASGIGQDVGISRSHVGDVLDGLSSKGLIERTKSPATGGPRWRITPVGIRALNLLDKRDRVQ